ncbi:hypothetical protein FOA52_012670 [Chlamydomonas sp. UWO 241]|nr:hypothetical protein FOA52_012670 [Chlamydomonas sp. UWO 241]
MRSSRGVAAGAGGRGSSSGGRRFSRDRSTERGGGRGGGGRSDNRCDRASERDRGSDRAGRSDGRGSGSGGNSGGGSGSSGEFSFSSSERTSGRSSAREGDASRYGSSRGGGSSGGRGGGSTLWQPRQQQREAGGDRDADDEEREGPSGGNVEGGGAEEGGAKERDDGDAVARFRAKRAGAHEYFVTCHPGLEEVVAQELRDLGIEAVLPGKAGVSFWSSKVADGYRACLWLRSAIRVLKLLHRSQLATDVDAGYRSGDSLYAATRLAAPWDDVIPPGSNFSIDSRVWSCTDLPSAVLASTRIKDAICDALRDAGRPKPPPPDRGVVPDLPLYASLFRDTYALYRDLSGISLHRRGYRDAMHKSPLNESAAAGVLLLAGWKGVVAERGDEALLVDPMCGSGTLLVEAALIARNVAPGLMRPAADWPFRRWPDADKQGIYEAVQEARDLQRPWNGRLLGNDSHAGALTLARRDAERAGFSDVVTFSEGDCADWVLPSPPSLVVVNPPWGVRLMGRDAASMQDGDGDYSRALSPELAGSWLALNSFLRSQCGGVAAAVLSGAQEPVNLLRMRPSRRTAMTVGGVECKLYQIKVLPPKGDQLPGAVPLPGSIAAPTFASVGAPRRTPAPDPRRSSGFDAADEEDDVAAAGDGASAADSHGAGTVVPWQRGAPAAGVRGRGRGAFIAGGFGRGAAAASAAAAAAAANDNGDDYWS